MQERGPTGSREDDVSGGGETLEERRIQGRLQELDERQLSKHRPPWRGVGTPKAIQGRLDERTEPRHRDENPRGAFQTRRLRGIPHQGVSCRHLTGDGLARREAGRSDLRDVYAPPDLTQESEIDDGRPDVSIETESKSRRPHPSPVQKVAKETPDKATKPREGRATEKERNIALARRGIAAEMRQFELRANATLWLAETIPKVCNQAIAMAKGDTTVKKLAGHVSAEFRAMLKLLQGGQTTGKPNANVPKHVDAAKDTKAPNQKKGNKTDKGPMSYAAIASQGDKGTKKTVELKSKTTTKTATKEKKQMVRVFIRGPTAADEGTAGEEVTKAVGSKPSEILMKKVNSGWALLHPPKTTATDKKLDQIREACGAKVCELEKKWTHARITNLADFYVLSDNGPVTQKKEEWFAKQIEKQTGGHVKSIKWQVETEKFKDATLRIALELPEGQPLPKTLTFDGSANSATVKRTHGGGPQRGSRGVRRLQDTRAFRRGAGVYNAPEQSFRISEALRELRLIEKEPNVEAREWPPLSQEEVKASIWRPTNTAPGADGISNEVWKRAWKPLGKVITGLYNLCLETGHHPATFKKANLVVFPKPGRPRLAPRSYRLISLLPAYQNRAGLYPRD
ncbi:putative double-stranded RNA/RNA-DNA hybrid binding protein [Ceratocystis lukuohia]|uniref:Double-stranded RNA/RNA-DNA hybrid binding protein n=1 Tax=Ceratocystis lukuohia TaxID=2019550 RepID=A0ABR4MJU6_9PEZI